MANSRYLASPLAPRRLSRALTMVAAAACLSAGCEPKTTTAPEPPRPRTPEERFAAIVETLKHGLETQSISAQSVARDGAPGAGDPVAAARIKVEHELFPPEKDGDPYRATVTFVSDSRVTMVLPPPSTEDKPPGKRTGEQTLPEVEIDGLDLEQLQVPSQQALAERMGNSPIKELESKDERKFELVLRDGRWAMVNEPDPDDEPYYDLVLRRAIKTQ